MPADQDAPRANGLDQYQAIAPHVASFARSQEYVAGVTGDRDPDRTSGTGDALPGGVAQADREIFLEVDFTVVQVDFHDSLRR